MISSTVTKYDQKVENKHKQRFKLFASNVSVRQLHDEFNTCFNKIKTRTKTLEQLTCRFDSVADSNLTGHSILPRVIQRQQNVTDSSLTSANILSRKLK